MNNSRIYKIKIQLEAIIAFALFISENLPQKIIKNKYKINAGI